MTRRVALVGMYGGYFGERNPGCFLILEATIRALERRMPDATFDIYCVDAIARFPEVHREVVHGRELRFFAQLQGKSLLETDLAHYDALVLGGDAILAPPPSPSIFLLESPSFQRSSDPPVFYNAAHTALSAGEILGGPHSDRFRNLCKRSDYVGVRTEYARDALRELGYADRVAFCPDPALSLELTELICGIDVPRLRREKKVLGVSVMAHFIDAIAEALLADSHLLKEFDVWIYPYSRQYNHIEAVLRIKQRYGAAFNYVDHYRDPLDTVALMSGFDASINDTYHGSIAALLLRIPFLAIDREDPVRSRSRNLLRLFSLEDRVVASSPHGLTDDSGDLLLGNALLNRWRDALPLLRTRPDTKLDAVRALINAHFDRIAHGIVSSAGRSAKIATAT